MPGNPITQDDKSRIMSTQMKNGKDTSAGSFAAQATSAADKHAAEGVVAEEGSHGNVAPSANRNQEQALDQGQGEDPITQDDKSRIMSEAMKAGENTSAGSFPARAQAAADRNARQGVVPKQGTHGNVAPVAREDPQQGLLEQGRPPTQDDKSRVMAEAMRAGKDTSAGSAVARLQSAADKLAAQGVVPKVGTHGNASPSANQKKANSRGSGDQTS